MREPKCPDCDQTMSFAPRMIGERETGTGVWSCDDCCKSFEGFRDGRLEE